MCTEGGIGVSRWHCEQIGGRASAAERIVLAGAGDIFDLGAFFVDALGDGCGHVDLVFGGSGVGFGGVRVRRLGVVGRRGALDDDFEFRDHRRDGGDSREDGRGNYSNGGHGERDFHESVTALVAHDDASHVAFVDQLADFVGEVLTAHLESFEDSIE